MLAPAPEATLDCFCLVVVVVVVVFVIGVGLLIVACCLAVDAAVGLVADVGSCCCCCLRIDFVGGFVVFIADAGFVFAVAVVAVFLALLKRVDAGPLSPSSESESPTSPSK